MGRVFDAMRKHSATDNSGAAKPKEKSEHRSESPRGSGLPSSHAETPPSLPESGCEWADKPPPRRQPVVMRGCH